MLTLDEIEPNILRENLLKLVEKPTKVEILSAKSELMSKMLDIDNPLELYTETLKRFEELESEYLALTSQIKESQKIVDNFWVAEPSFTQEDYIREIEKIQNDNKDILRIIKKKETIVKSLEKRLDAINEKMEIEIAKEKKENIEKQDTINEIILRQKEAISNIKLELEDCDFKITDNNRQLNIANPEYLINSRIYKELEENNVYRCPFCGTVAEDDITKEIVKEKLEQRINVQKDLINMIQKQIKKLEDKKVQLTQDLAIIKKELSNNKKFKKSTKETMYKKKNMNRLEMESERNAIAKQLLIANKDYKNEKEKFGTKYFEIDNKLKRYNLSLKNMELLKENSQILAQKQKKQIELQDAIRALKYDLDNFVTYLTTESKIIQNRLHTIFGEDYTFEINEINNYNITPVIHIYFKGKRYNKYPKDMKEIISQRILGKIHAILEENH